MNGNSYTIQHDYHIIEETQQTRTLTQYWGNFGPTFAVNAIIAQSL